MKTGKRFPSFPDLRQRGINLVELMITLLLAGVIVAAAVVLTVHYSQNNAQQERLVDLQNNLRMASEHISARLRRSGYSTPEALAAWIPDSWPPIAVAATPDIGSGTVVVDDELIVVSCSSRPQAYLRATLMAGATSMALTSAVPGKSIADLFDTTGRSLLMLMSGADKVDEFALVRGLSVNGLTIDHEPQDDSPQGFSRSYFAGTPVCRLDIAHYQVDSSKKTLQVNEYQGAGWQDVFDGISSLEVKANVPQPGVYTVILTGQTDEAKPVERTQAFSVTTRKP